MKLNIAVCDDNGIALNDEYNLICSVLDENNIEYSAEKFNNPMTLLQSKEHYNIVFLDVEMNSIDGIQTANEVRKKNKECLIFFVTNYERYLDDAFNQRAFRFWTKPLDRRKLTYGLKSAIDEINAMHHRINIKIDGIKNDIYLHNVVYIYMENKRLHIITVKGEIITDDTLKNIYDQIKNIDYFIETCRGYYVNMNYVRNYTRDNIVCSYKQEVYNVCISRRKYNNFRQACISWIGGR